MGKKVYNTVLFDVDGTLLDFEAAEREGVRHVLQSQGIEPTDELTSRYRCISGGYWKAFERGEISREQIMGHRFADFFETVGLAVDGAVLEQMFREQLNQHAVLLEGALEICEYLKGRYRMYIVTNGISETQYQRLAVSGLDQFFDDIFVSEDAMSQKPQRAYFDYCFSKIPDADPQQMLIVGDSLSSDIKGGNTAGIDTCWYNPGKFGRKAGIRVDYEIRRLEELKQIL